MRKTLLILLATVMILLAACGGNSNNNTNSNTNNNNTPAGNNGSSNNEQVEDVTLRYSWWGSDARHKAILEAIEIYEGLNPHVKIEAEYGAFGSYYQKLLTELSGGTAPDIISVDYKWVQDLISKGKPFVDMYTMQDQIDMSGFDMDFAAEHGGDGGTYLLGLPLAINTIGFVYNEDLAAEAGIDMNNEWDWDTVIAAGEKLREHDDSKYLMIMSMNHYIYYMKTRLKQMTGNNLFHDDYTFGFEREQLVEVFTYFREMLDKGILPPFEEATQYSSASIEEIPGWIGGEYLIGPTSASKILPIEHVSSFETGVARYPVPEDAVNPGIITTPSMLITINKESDHIDEAAKFINWMLNDEEANLAVKDTIGLPANEPTRSLLLEQNLVEEKVVDLVQTSMPFAGTAENALSINQEIDAILKDYVERLGFGLMSAEEAADGLMEEVGNKLQELEQTQQ